MKKIIACLICLLFLAGCNSGSDYIEPENRIIVSALGIDQIGVDVFVTVECININTTNNKDSYDIKVITGYGSDLKSAVHDIKTKLDGELLLSQCQVLLLNRNLSAEALSNIYTYILDEESISLAIRLVACDNANELIVNNNDKKPMGYQVMSLLRFCKNTFGFTGGDSFVKVANRNKTLYKMPYIGYDDCYKIVGVIYHLAETVVELDILNSQILYMLCGDLKPCEINFNEMTINFCGCKINEKKDVLNIKIVIENNDQAKESKIVLEKAIKDMLLKFNYDKSIYVSIVGEM